MKLPLHWLEQYVASPGKPEIIAERFTLSGSEVEKTTTIPEGLSNIIVGQILEIDKHLNADRLQLAKVKIGNGKTTRVVCGAPNIAVGQKVPVALPGITLPNGMKLEITKIRGVESKGMLCAEDELGLGTNHAGIMILDSRTPLGMSLPNALGLSPAVFDIDVTSNRGDCFSIIGLAREYAALTGKKIKQHKISKLPLPKKKKISVKIVSKKACSAYYACRISGIIVGPSPQWMQTALREVDIRPINNIVDITNYVMIATGQPMHVFDAAKIGSTKAKIDISVRHAQKDEKILALDDTEYTLEKSMLVISDSKGPIALAGVIGGKNSSVDSSTKEIVFEAAHFDAPITRKAAQKIGIRTESSSRFEKGINREGISDALAYAVELVKTTTGGTIEELAIEPAPKEIKKRQVFISYDRVARIIGMVIPKSKIKQLLTSLGFEVKDAPGNKARITVPFHRLDVSLEEDIIEEIVRMFGVNNLKSSTMHMDVTAPLVDPKRVLAKKLHQTMVAHGFYEVYLYSFYGEKDRKADCLSMFCDGRFDHLEVHKPLSPEQKYIRKSLLPQIIKVLVKNIGIYGGNEVKVFELGKTFIPQGDTLPHEHVILAGGMSFAKSNTEKQLLYIKGVVESILSASNLKESFNLKNLHDRGIVFEVNGRPIAMAYILSKQDLTQYKLKKPVALFEISATLLNELTGPPQSYKPYSHFPSVTRDVALEVAPGVLWGEIKKAVSGKNLVSVTFQSQYALENKKSLAFRLVFRSKEKTLTSEQVDIELKKIIALLEKRFDATIRGK
jgi:phenylalanyl-tRNA synthetase beta chain